jgi:N-acetylmuramate 1-kinase
MPSRPVPPDLLPWVMESLGAVADTAQSGLTMIAGDASNRRYFRLHIEGRPYIVVEAPPQTEKNTEFLAVRKLLEGAGVRVPCLFAAELSRGYMVLEDLGDRVLLAQLNAESATGYYRSAFGLLRKMAALEGADVAVPAYDRGLLTEEFGRFQQWFVQGLLGCRPTASEAVLIDKLGEQLIFSALEQPRVLVHRDFHSRNLMLLPGEEMAVIDFQDAVYGPVTYDLSSLLKDCYIRWPEERVKQWALAFLAAMPDSHRQAVPDEASFLRWFDWMGLQRHIKVLGTFSRLYLRDGKTGYLDDLPLVLCYVQETLESYAGQEPVFAEFGQWFRERLLPLIRQQPWSAQL